MANSSSRPQLSGLVENTYISIYKSKVRRITVTTNFYLPVARGTLIDQSLVLDSLTRSRCNNTLSDRSPIATSRCLLIVNKAHIYRPWLSKYLRIRALRRYGSVVPVEPLGSLQTRRQYRRRSGSALATITTRSTSGLIISRVSYNTIWRMDIP
jgi:hypothetical protein